jgi:hypothetical protein
MTLPQTLRRTLAVALVALQGALGGATTAIHAAERSAAPTAIEREHGPSCPVVHDAARCAACQHSVQGPATTAPRWAAAGPDGPPAEPPCGRAPASAAADHPNSRSPPPERA